ncbi:class I SAM-dependent methyltransferase [Mycolicibacterium fortuitum]|uniref:class I SAM-dependent methyltransferase n=1 Tax=Mycolicibacterium fortuitum TaxID=1766 RepID=UPI0007E92E53|nr:class I SAM-dependent methyltransferase [Mycolicibacterium fortuitum]NOQ56690.1 class I SAM-dependent methyltransferase [Mycolicibacterium fortuitum]NOQ98922.1 class I SAM-dependent methyltransferase [Mycolicibacterium fortuitum]OBB24685.1 SAM-dependent methyltransferase [Mycolicibacterium fortuitum]OBI68289.1 SAM-dependent methyltransferase [Mycolicibacterium fortuitum]
MNAARAINHHADHPGFAGVTGVLCGLVFLLVGRAKAKMAADIAQVSSSDHVVDVGCGPGTAARVAARRAARVTGVDPSSTMLRIARLVTPKRAPVTWSEGTAETLPVAGGSATVLWALATVHHWQDVDEAVAEARRVLAPGGRLIAIERQSPDGATGLASHGWTRQQAEAFGALCRNTGFDDVSVAERGNGRKAVWVVCGKRR